MTQYCKYISETRVEYPTASEFAGVVNWKEHDPMLRLKGYCPISNMPEAVDGKITELDTFAYHPATAERIEPRSVEVDDYEEDPETHEQIKVGSHIEWRDTVITVDVSTVTVESYHYEDDPSALHMAIADKVFELEEWDNAELPDKGVNWFTLQYNGADIVMWIKKADRAALQLTIDSAEATGKSSITVWAEGTAIDLPIQTGRQMLYALEAYASSCYCVTASHKKAINELTDIAAVNAYDFKAGYPEHPVFSV